MSTTHSAANGRDIPVYHSTADGVNAWISALGNYLPGGKGINIWIEVPGELAASDGTEKNKGTRNAAKEERRETSMRIRRLTHWPAMGRNAIPAGSTRRFASREAKHMPAV